MEYFDARLRGITMKPNLGISFSGGRTSAVMTKLCLETMSDEYNISVTFANTGQEHESTLDFVRDCDNHFGFNTVWLEAVVGGEGVGIQHKIVDYDSASRNGEPFEEVIKKYGIPCMSHPQCTSRLKEEVMYDFRRSLGWKRNTYYTAIGIRADEMDRISDRKDELKLIYPLARLGWTVEMVKAECKKWPFDLQIPGDHYGNCVVCWKKSMRKLMTIAKEQPERFDFFDRMEQKYSNYRADNDTGKRVFFRENRSSKDVIELSNQEFTPYSDSAQLNFIDLIGSEWLDRGSSCGESCEIGGE